MKLNECISGSNNPIKNTETTNAEQIWASNQRNNSSTLLLIGGSAHFFPKVAQKREKSFGNNINKLMKNKGKGYKGEGYKAKAYKGKG